MLEILGEKSYAYFMVVHITTIHLMPGGPFLGLITHPNISFLCFKYLMFECMFEENVLYTSFHIYDVQFMMR